MKKKNNNNNLIWHIQNKNNKRSMLHLQFRCYLQNQVKEGTETSSLKQVQMNYSIYFLLNLQTSSQKFLIIWPLLHVVL